MHDKTELSLLLDYYGGLLTERQREFMRLSSDDDMSLSEISELYGVSRQGVRDAIIRGSKLLSSAEEKLRMVSRDRRMYEIIGRISDMINGLNVHTDQIKPIVDELELLQRVMEDRDGV